MNEYFVEAKNIIKNFGNIVAVNDVSFYVKKGEILGFIGADGAGKTTLFRIIATLMLPDNGEVKIGKFDVVNDYKIVRQMIGYMPQKFSLYQDLTVEENLDFFATIFGTTIKENYDTIKEIYSQLEPFKTRKTGNLSGGMKQKLALSCALIHKPKLLLLDEPTTGVDPISRREFWDILRSIQEKGVTIIVSTPYMNEANMCNRVALVQKGRILTIDTPKNIITNYQNNLIAVRSSNNTYNLILDLEKFYDCKTAFPFGDFVHYTSISNRNDELYLEELTNYLIQKGYSNIDLFYIKPNIEDCFMDLMIEKEE